MNAFVEIAQLANLVLLPMVGLAVRYAFGVERRLARIEAKMGVES